MRVQLSTPPGSESHFKVIVVSMQFEKVRVIERHRKIQNALKEELAGALRCRVAGGVDTHRRPTKHTPKYDSHSTGVNHLVWIVPVLY